MKRKKNQNTMINTIIGTDARIEGELSFEGAIRIDGTVVGRVVSGSGAVIVGDGAKVEAEITVGSAIIRGEVIGTVEASDRIEVYPPARVVGDIKAPVISIDTGVVFNGNCIMTEPKKKNENQEKKKADGAGEVKSFPKTG